MSALPVDLIDTAVDLDPSWREQGRCMSSAFSADDFFLEGRFAKGSRLYNAAKARAKAVCAACPVRNQCLEYAIANDIRFGIWGGMTSSERRTLRYAA